jgi:hypothetical protein
MLRLNNSVDRIRITARVRGLDRQVAQLGVSRFRLAISVTQSELQMLQRYWSVSRFTTAYFT